jgi:hypothetical protein
MMARWTRWMLLGLAVGCGGDDDGGNTTRDAAVDAVAVDASVDAPANLADCTFVACGGNPTGTWQIDKFCIDFDGIVLDPDCPTMTFDWSGVTVSGTAVFNADMTYAINSVSGGSLSYTIPAACIPPQVQQCSSLGATCTGNPAQSCTCTEAVDEQDSEAGTWSTSGTTLTITPDGEDPFVGEYCATSSVFKLHQPKDVAEDEPGFTMVLTR